MAQSFKPYPHLREPASQEVRLIRSLSTDWWGWRVKVTLGKKVVEADSACNFGSLEDADRAAEAFIQDVLKTLVHGEGGTHGA